MVAIYVVKFLLPFKLEKSFECNETRAMRDVPFSNSKSYFEHKSTNGNCVMESSITVAANEQMETFLCIYLHINLNNVILSLSLFQI